MTKAKIFRTTFSIYQSTEIIGEGGSGIVFKVDDQNGEPFALKLLKKENLTNDKLGRFKNEIHFCQKNTHENIIKIIDHGTFFDNEDYIPFYVMPLYSSSLRLLINDKIDHEKIMLYYSDILDGVEAAHLQGIVHRDLKPENILFDIENENLIIADFGIARFIEENILTAVETRPGTRIANFQYAAPEQRMRGREIGIEADIYALGLICNEMFTGEIPYGTDFMQIQQINGEYAYLDKLIAEMIKQKPEGRPFSIGEIKQKLISYGNEFITQQRISQLENTIIPTSDIDDPLILDPPTLVRFDYQDGNLILILSREVNNTWVWALNNMGNHSSVHNKGPERFKIVKNRATISANSEFEAQSIINYFKEWLPKTNSVYERKIRRENEQKERAERQRLQTEIEKQKQRERILMNVKI